MKISEHREQYIKADAEGRMKLLAKVYGLSAHQMWKHKQSGKWIISHAGVQAIAAQEGVIVRYQTEYLTPEMCVVLATPMIGEREGQSTYGEASELNYKTKPSQPRYNVPMAEKRGYDRAVLITVLQTVGGYGADFYAEDEADDFKAAKPAEIRIRPDTIPAPQKPVVNYKPQPTTAMLKKYVAESSTVERLESVREAGVKHKDLWTADVENAYLDRILVLTEKEA